MPKSNTKKLNWADCTVEQYTEIQELLTEELTPTEFTIEVGAMFLDLDEDLSASELDRVSKAIALVYTEPPKTSVQMLNANPEWKKKTFTSFTLGQFIDLDVIVTSNSLADCVEKCVPYLYGCTPDIVNELKIIEVYGALKDFLKYREDTLKTYETIFDVSDPDDPDDEEYDEEPTTPEDSRVRWMKTVFGLANGDITKADKVFSTSHILAFNWVTIAESLKSHQQVQTGDGH